MIRTLHIFERFSIIRRCKYSFIEKCIYLTLYLEGLYYYTKKVCLVQYYVNILNQHSQLFFDMSFFF